MFPVPGEELEVEESGERETMRLKRRAVCSTPAIGESSDVRADSGGMVASRETYEEVPVGEEQDVVLLISRRNIAIKNDRDLYLSLYKLISK